MLNLILDFIFGKKVPATLEPLTMDLHRYLVSAAEKGEKVQFSHSAMGEVVELEPFGDVGVNSNGDVWIVLKGIHRTLVWRDTSSMSSYPITKAFSLYFNHSNAKGSFHFNC